jgi:hypothetical protein
MLEACSDHTVLKWRRTAFARIYGVIEAAEDDWSLYISKLPAARIYACAAASMTGDGSGLCRFAQVARHSPAGRVMPTTGTGLVALAKLLTWQRVFHFTRRPRKNPSFVVFCLIFAVAPCSSGFTSLLRAVS